MVEKVLVADDSLTIQKVVGITLADTSYEIEQCLTEEELLDKIQSNYYNLILLDFNFSEDMTGYELAQLVALKSPNSAILAMLGTFDTVDESELNKCGVLDKVVKPFESDKFIQKCQALVELTADGSLDASALEDKPVVEKVEEAEEEISLGEGWIVDSPRPEDTPVEEEKIEINLEQQSESQDALSSEMEGWGMQVPGIIGEEDTSSYGVFPPVIEEDNVVSLVQSSDAVLEEGSELIEQLEANNELEDSVEVEAQFDSIEELSPVEESESFDEETDPHIQMPEEFTAELVTEIEELGSPDDFWAVEGESKGVDESVTQEPISVDSLEVEEEAVVEQVSASHAPIDEKAMVEQITNTITPMIEEMVRHFCQQKIEQVAWEVIPDLAENIIKKELKEIADSVRS